MAAVYLPILLTLIVAVLVAGGIFIATSVFGPKNPTPEKMIPYECGSESSGGRHVKLSVKFYLTAILFIVFDVEVVFMYPYAVVFRQLGWGGFAAMAIFLFVAVIGLLYEWRKGALQWE